MTATRANENEEKAITGLCSLRTQYVTKLQRDRTIKPQSITTATSSSPTIETIPYEVSQLNREEGDLSIRTKQLGDVLPSRRGGIFVAENNTTTKNDKMKLDDADNNTKNKDPFLINLPSIQNPPNIDLLQNIGQNIITPHPHDVLSGRGNGANQHPGNIFFRDCIHEYKPYYISTAGPTEKKLIIKRIIEIIQQRNPPGRFLKQNNETDLWDCLDMDQILKKTGQALREKPPELKKKKRMWWDKECIKAGEEISTSFTTEPYFKRPRLYENVRSVKEHLIIPSTSTAVHVLVPHQNDVLFCNGVIVLGHPGSEFFCEQINQLLPQYNKGSTVMNEKRLENKIIETIGARWPPGRFLCKMNMMDATTINSNSNCCDNDWQLLSFDQASQITRTLNTKGVFFQITIESYPKSTYQ